MGDVCGGYDGLCDLRGGSMVFFEEVMVKGGVCGMNVQVNGGVRALTGFPGTDVGYSFVGKSDSGMFLGEDGGSDVMNVRVEGATRISTQTDGTPVVRIHSGLNIDGEVRIGADLWAAMRRDGADLVLNGATEFDRVRAGSRILSPSGFPSSGNGGYGFTSSANSGMFYDSGWLLSVGHAPFAC